MNKDKPPLRVYIADDETLARARLKRLLTQCHCEVIGEADNGEQALGEIQNLHPDLVLLDIRMPGLDGLQVAQGLSRMQPAPAIVFCTAYDEYAIKAFQLNASSYLLKPARQAELEAALRSATQLSQAQLQQLDLHTQREHSQSFKAHTWQGLECIELEDIYYFQADHKYVTVVHRNGETLSDHSLKDIHKEFGEQLFRAHRNALVNIAHIRALTKDGSSSYQFELSNGNTVGISRRAVAKAKALIKAL